MKQSDSESAFTAELNRSESASVLWCLSLDGAQRAQLKQAASRANTPVPYLPVLPDEINRSLQRLSTTTLLPADTMAVESVLADLTDSVLELDPPDVKSGDAQNAIGDPKSLPANVFSFIRGHLELPRPQLALGLYRPGKFIRDFKDTQTGWYPEFNLRATYGTRDVHAFLDAIKGYAAHFLQYAVLIDLTARHGTSTSTWIMEMSDDTSTEENSIHPMPRFNFKCKGTTKGWELKCAGVQWFDQFSQIRQALSFERSNPRSAETQAARRRHVRSAGKDIDDDFGAQILRGTTDDCLQVLIAASPALMFESFFLPVLFPRSRKTLPSDSRRRLAILLNSDSKPPDQIVPQLTYTFFTDDPVNYRCLCGGKYPAHRPGTDANDAEVVPLRSCRKEWISDQYTKIHRGDTDPWGELSSPHFFLIKHSHQGVYLETTKILGDHWRKRILPR